MRNVLLKKEYSYKKNKIKENLTAFRIIKIMERKFKRYGKKN